MTTLRAVLSLMLIAIVGYTALVIPSHGINLFAVFFTDIAATGWPGQFNFDFFMMLLLSGFWVAWRHEFTPAGLALALLATLGGILFLTIYLLVQSRSANGSIQALLLGPARARQM